PPAASAGAQVPEFSYPYSRAREALEQLRRGAVDASHGFRLQYLNAAGASPMPTIAAFLQLLPGGFSGRARRQTDAAVYVGVEGQGRAHVGGRVFDWHPRDVF